eukprot:GHRQ01022009.1.p2 GENE.GHRQ01022009.1~~GHRQ01022009.1.p2  ORF type:complete len:151 (+),score=34.57 GHRQ01022009.1:11-463(+)
MVSTTPDRTVSARACFNSTIEPVPVVTARARAACACRYAAKVAKGYRPARPKRISPGVWQLIEACWHQEPCARPSMAKVVEVLQGLAADELASKSAGRRTARKPAAPVAVDAASADGNIKEAACGAAHPANSGSRPAEGTARQPGCCVIS